MKARLIFAFAAMVLGCSEVSPPTAAPTPSTRPIPPTVGPTTTPLASTPAPTVATASAPGGYERSCAAEFPWARQVSRAFVCLESAASRPDNALLIDVRGYAGGSFENNVVLELWTVDSGQPLLRRALTYTAPDVGMPGYFATTFNIEDPAKPGDRRPQYQPGPARVVAHFDSPRDGSRVAEDVIDFTLR